MPIKNVFIIALCILLISTVIACIGPVTDNTTHKSSSGKTFTREQVIEIAMAFSPDCRKKIPPEEGKG